VTPEEAPAEEEPGGPAEALLGSEPAPASDEEPPAFESAPDLGAPAGGEAAASPDEVRNILLVDDEEDVRRVLSDRFHEAGYQIVEADDPETAVRKANRLGKAGVPFLLVTDLGMPTSGGSSFQGGFEVVKRLAKMNLRPPVLMMTESFGPALKTRARQLEVASFVFKPGLSKLDPAQFEADLKAFADKILRDVLPGLSRRASRRAAGSSASPAAPEAPTAPATDQSGQSRMLQDRLAELGRSPDPTRISSLVMTVARDFFERAALFLVKNEEVRGLGGFGPAPATQTLNLIVREVNVPLSEPSVFLDVVMRRRPFYGPLPEGRWSEYLIGRIGRFKARAVAVLPLVAHRDAIAVLYGDNPESGREPGRQEALEVFIQQAGAALENAFLQRKLQDLKGRDAAPVA
jgi:CheY-like chemotaxis protein